MEPRTENMTNFVCFDMSDGTGRTRIGHLDRENDMIIPLAFESGTAVESLYQVIEVGKERVVAGGEPFPLSQSIKILPPISGRDILAVGKNYAEHAKEFNASGYDASDKNDMPSHPVIFSKRATSIIACGEDILLHPGFTETLDYEGEIGVIVGKGGYRILEEDAESHVFGYTIINDVTAREKQRDHKQFYIGKSADTYCPMGPMAVPASTLPKVLTVTTRVNGEERQKGTTEDLIFSIATLIKTLSESQTLRPGDVIATGTPAGVGFGLSPPVFLKAGDVVEISVTGLGTLWNKVAEADASNYVSRRVGRETTIPTNNLSITNGGLGLVAVRNGKKINAITIGTGPRTIIFIHGLGGNTAYYSPLIRSLGLDKRDQEKYTCLLFDLEGHGMSPTKATSKVSIESYAQDIEDLLHSSLNVKTQNSATLVAHSMGCLVASLFASQHPKLVKRLVLISPPPCPLPKADADCSITRAATVRREGMRNVAMTVATAGTSVKTKADRPLALAAVQMSLLSQDPEGYAKGCTALAGAKDLSIDFKMLGQRFEEKTLIVTGDEDETSPLMHVKKLVECMGSAKLEVLKGVGHWPGFEDVEGLSSAIKIFLG